MLYFCSGRLRHRRNNKTIRIESWGILCRICLSGNHISTVNVVGREMKRSVGGTVNKWTITLYGLLEQLSSLPISLCF